ncbi:MAG: hypothetical protein IAF02_04165 [Anaerolineae bacterium]|nr:hypothetical protein [Anaerolineae bacterium]
MEKRRFQKYLTDRNISLIIRWWAAGAVYFFIGWGTGLGNQQYLIDFVVILGLIMGMFNIIIINPGLRMMFNIYPRRPRQEDTAWQRISDYLVEMLKNIFIMYLIAMLYIVINKSLIALLNLTPETVPLPGEPILFGLFYVIIFVLIEKIAQKIKEMVRNFKAKKAE